MDNFISEKQDIKLTSYFKNLRNKVIDSSNAKAWHLAVKEWKIIDCEEDEEAESQCICGKESLRYLYTIKNIHNDNTLYPIGSSCIKRFERPELNETITIQEKMFRLLRAMGNNERIIFTSEFFSRKILKELFIQGAFQENQYNHYNGENDYNFLLEMFNKQEKKRTERQKGKIIAIIMSSIRPYLKAKLESKVKRKQL